MLESIPASQFDEWCAYDQIEPLNQTELNTGLLATFVAGFMGVSESKIEELRRTVLPGYEQVEEVVPNLGRKSGWQ